MTTKVKLRVGIGEQEAGETVDLSDDEAAILVREGYAEEPKTKKEGS